MNATRTLIAAVFAAVIAAISLPAAADASITNTVALLDGTSAFGNVRIYMAGPTYGTALCGSGTTDQFLYLNTSDPNFDFMHRVLLAAKVTGATVQVTGTTAGSSCHLTYIRLQ